MKRATKRRLENTVCGIFKSVMVLQATMLIWAVGFMLVKLFETTF
tara:strand:- start:2554 stop:2688 length:135 start_codon:yes stop_codon:yes gene_type:complete